MQGKRTKEKERGKRKDKKRKEKKVFGRGRRSACAWFVAQAEWYPRAGGHAERFAAEVLT
eukprot:184072-Prorocentrum_minimum.AAC.1